GYGLTVITHDNLSQHTPEIHALKDGYNGVLFRDGDSSDLAAKVQHLGRDPDYRAALSRNALRTVQEEYNMDVMARNFLGALRKANAASLLRK
ncbi:MAG: glycosyltransferase, partial [Syntrophobacteraceae bacterium]